MKGDDQTRHCGQCDRKVYNLSNMTRDEAEKLVTEAEGRICVRYYVRKDGMVMTRDCGEPAPTPNKRHLAFAALAAAIPLLAGCNNEPELPLMGKLAMPEPTQKVETPQAMMGSVDYPAILPDKQPGKGLSKK